MNACIYARTARDDKSHDRTTVDNQIAFSRELARRHNLTVEPEHVFTDIDHEGHERGWKLARHVDLLLNEAAERAVPSARRRDHPRETDRGWREIRSRARRLIQFSEGRSIRD